MPVGQRAFVSLAADEKSVAAEVIDDGLLATQLAVLAISSTQFLGGLDGLRLRRIGEDAGERQGGDKQRTENSFHRALLRLADAGSGSCL